MTSTGVNGGGHHPHIFPPWRVPYRQLGWMAREDRALWAQGAVEFNSGTRFGHRILASLFLFALVHHRRRHILKPATPLHHQDLLGELCLRLPHLAHALALFHSPKILVTVDLAARVTARVCYPILSLLVLLRC